MKIVWKILITLLGVPLLFIEPKLALIYVILCNAVFLIVDKKKKNK